MNTILIFGVCNMGKHPNAPGVERQKVILTDFSEEHLRLAIKARMCVANPVNLKKPTWHKQREAEIGDELG